MHHEISSSARRGKSVRAALQRFLDDTTRFDDAAGIDEMRIESIRVGDSRLVDSEARAWVEARASAR